MHIHLPSELYTPRTVARGALKVYLSLSALQIGSKAAASSSLSYITTDNDAPQVLCCVIVMPKVQ